MVVIVAVLASGCGAAKPTTSDSATGDSAAQQQQASAREAAARRQARRDRARARKLTAWLRKQRMTPGDLYRAGIEAPEPMLKVYLIKRITVHGSTVRIHTSLYSKPDNANEFAGACNQVVGGYDASWVKPVEVDGQDGARHALWSDEDRDGADDSSGFLACQADV
jgi:type II secretory pathway pseudopilin PulG